MWSSEFLKYDKNNTGYIEVEVSARFRDYFKSIGLEFKVVAKSQYRSVTVSQCHSVTVSQFHSVTVS